MASPGATPRPERPTERVAADAAYVAAAESLRAATAELTVAARDALDGGGGGGSSGGGGGGDSFVAARLRAALARAEGAAVALPAALGAKRAAEAAEAKARARSVAARGSWLLRRMVSAPAPPAARTTRRATAHPRR
jgi:hypothetical protein